MPWAPIDETSVYLVEDKSRQILREDFTPLLREGPFSPWNSEDASGHWTPIAEPVKPWVEA